MKLQYHKIRGVDKSVCTAEQKIAYNMASRIYGDVENLPNPMPNTIYIVSALVASRVPTRSDVFYPCCMVRDTQGRVIGCKTLCCAAAPVLAAVH